MGQVTELCGQGYDPSASLPDPSIPRAQSARVPDYQGLCRLSRTEPQLLEPDEVLRSQHRARSKLTDTACGELPRIPVPSADEQRDGAVSTQRTAHQP